MRFMAGHRGSAGTLSPGLSMARCMSEVMRAEEKKKGDSLGPAAGRKVKSPEELSGTFKFRMGLAKLLREMEDGWRHD